MWNTLGTVRLAVGFLGVLAALLGKPSLLHAQVPQSISVIVFPGDFNWPIWVAQQKDDGRVVAVCSEPDIARTEINGTRQRSQVDLERFRSHTIPIAVAIMAPALRIVSFLPSATEMACALGLAEQLVGVTHECDYPREIKGKPIVVRSALPVENMSDQEIDRAVSERLRKGQSVYRVDEQLLRELTPDLILTQDLCQVCAPSGNEVSQVLNALPYKPKILWLTAKSLDEIFDNMRQLGAATGRSEQAEALIDCGRAHLDGIATMTYTLPYRPRVFCMEWLDPVYCSGHWVAEMVRIAGGRDELGREGADSVRIAWTDVLRWEPEILVLMPCGFDLEKTIAHAQGLSAYPGWKDIPAVRSGRVYAVNANAYFARPGPRVVDGTDLLAHLIHPDLFEWTGPGRAFTNVG